MKTYNICKRICWRVQQVVVIILEKLVEERDYAGVLGLARKARGGSVLGDPCLISEGFVQSGSYLKNESGVCGLVEQRHRTWRQTRIGTVQSHERFLKTLAKHRHW